MAIIGKLTIKRKFWFTPALYTLSVACALVSFLSYRLADRLYDAGTSFLVKRGIDHVVTIGEG